MRIGLEKWKTKILNEERKNKMMQNIKTCFYVYLTRFLFHYQFFIVVEGEHR